MLREAYGIAWDGEVGFHRGAKMGVGDAIYTPRRWRRGSKT